ncbi:MAG: sigma-54-dependent Fis family transcriptional regulator [Gemmatimonadetes bacterium]|nr:sigma-54-dependent Fis family transcriptional regulator [Gemmatimonadota bacterium]
MATILCLDDEASAVLVLEDALQRAGHRTVGVHNVPAAMKVLARGGVDLVISDYRMPGATGLEFLAQMEKEGLDVPLIMVTGYGSIEHAVAAIKAGAIDYITKPVRAQQLQLAVEQALELSRLKRENAQLREEVTQFRSAREIVGESPALTRILETVRMVASTRAAVLFQGESGTGKELLARTVHALSERRDGPFISINCAALPENLVESTLFGHEKGAFTGAGKQVKGAFERAHGGTLLLDEVSEMRLDLQAKLLRVLQEQEFERVGGTTAIKVDVRIVATTNRALAGFAAAGSLREDLYYRLAVVPIQVPPLRDRLDDLPLLLAHFAARAARDVGRPVPQGGPGVGEMLQAYGWPGNLRELSHAVERAVILTPSGMLVPDSFDPGRFGLASGATAGPGAFHAAARSEPAGAGTPATLNLSDMEAILIGKALEATGNNRTRAADLLGISVRTLRNKLNTPLRQADAD